MPSRFHDRTRTTDRVEYSEIWSKQRWIEGSFKGCPHRVRRFQTGLRASTALRLIVSFFATLYAPHSLVLTCLVALQASSGVKSFYRGHLASALRHVPYSGVRFYVFEAMRQRLGANQERIETHASEALHALARIANGRRGADPSVSSTAVGKAEGEIPGRGFVWLLRIPRNPTPNNQTATHARISLPS